MITNYDIRVIRGKIFLTPFAKQNDPVRVRPFELFDTPQIFAVFVNF